MGIISGYPDGTFKPDEPIARGAGSDSLQHRQAVRRLKDVYRCQPQPLGTQQHHERRHKGRVVGYADGTFRPDAPITRAETMTLINNVLNREANAEGLIEGYAIWPDNIAGEWYYFDVIEAAPRMPSGTRP